MLLQINWRRPLIYLLLTTSGSSIYKNIRYLQWLQAQSVEFRKKEQEKKLKRILFYAYKKVPYYNELLPKVGVINRYGKIDLTHFDDIPPLTKEIITKTGSSLQAADIENRQPYGNTSGGSTGEPVNVLQDTFYSDWNIANKLFIKLTYGQHIGQKEMRLWGSYQDILKNYETISSKAKTFLYNRNEINTFRLSTDDLEMIVKTWNKIQPSWVEGYAHSLEELAQYIGKNNVLLSETKGILSTAGALSDESSSILNAQTNSPIINRYGCREVGDIAFTLPGENELSICTWSHHVSFGEDESFKDSRMKNLYITSLTNFSMPLIKYKIGDIGIKSAQWGYIESIQGRETNFFINTRGEKISGGYLRYILYHKDWIKKYQIVQENETTIIFRIVKQTGENPPQVDIEDIANKAKILMGKDCRILFEYVDKINPTKSGKYLFTISKVK